MPVQPAPLKSEPKHNHFHEFGVLDWGYTEESSPLSLKHFLEWESQGKNTPLQYMSGDRAHTRKDLKNYYPNFQSALVFLFSYQEAKNYLKKIKSKQKIASYVFGFDGHDYHYVLKEKLKGIAHFLELENYKICVDTAPILERDLAYRSGLGWFGKNSMLIHREYGSYFLLASILIPKKLPQFLTANILETDHCGQCLRCVQACPTNAIDGSSRTLNASACISTFTIEVFKEVDPPQGYEKSQGEIFGCDICQDVCPWNDNKLTETLINKNEKFVFLENFLLNQTIEEIENELKIMSLSSFKKYFKNTSLERSGKKGLLKNIFSFKKFFK